MNENINAPASAQQTPYQSGSLTVSQRQLQARHALYAQSANARSSQPLITLPQTFADALMEAAAELVPDVKQENQERDIRTLLSQTAVMNLMATAPNNLAALQPAILGYAVHVANQVQLESTAPIRFRPGDRFQEQDRIDGHLRVPPTNEIRNSPEVL